MFEAQVEAAIARPSLVDLNALVGSFIFNRSHHMCIRDA